MKTVSSDNLARFKAKCDETYQKKGSGGITNAEVIEYAEQLPAASETSPNFIQTPDGTLYRKKAVESTGGLVGTWVINSANDGIATGTSYNVSFTSNGSSYTSMSGRTGFFPGDAGIRYDDSTVYTQTSGWDNENLRTINITDISALTNVDEFTTWLTANATGGGASVSYEYVAMQEVPTPTTADNGKVLGVTNGTYALQEAGGGGVQLYLHDVTIGTYQLKCFSTVATEFTTVENVTNNIISGTEFNNMGSATHGSYIGYIIDSGSDTTEFIYTTNGTSITSRSVGSFSSVSDTVTPL